MDSLLKDNLDISVFLILLVEEYLGLSWVNAIRFIDLKNSVIASTTMKPDLLNSYGSQILFFPPPIMMQIKSQWIQPAIL